MNDYESTISKEGWERSFGKKPLAGGILATIHLLDGRTVYREFRYVDYKPYADIVTPERELLRVWMDNAKWIESGPNEYTPMSQVLKITWTQIPTQQ